MTRALAPAARRRLRLALPLLVSLLALSAVASALGPAPSASAGARPRAVFLSMDGFGADLLDEGWVDRYMPRLSGLLDDGAVALRSRSSFPSITPTGHSALWTGAYGGISGITGSSLLRLPAGRHTILETISGFSSIPQRAEPVWIAAPRQGLRTVVVGATQVYPFRRWLQADDPAPGPEEAKRVRDHLTALDFYAGRLAREQVITWEDLSADGSRKAAPDDPEDPGTADVPARPPAPESSTPADVPLRFRRDVSLGLEREPAVSPLHGRAVRATLTGAWRASRPGGPRDRLDLSLEIARSGRGDAPDDEDRTGSDREERIGEDRQGGDRRRIARLTLPAPSERFHSLRFDVLGVPAFAVVKVLAADEERREFVLFVSTPATLRALPPATGEEIVAELGGLYGNGAGYAYRDGHLGPTIPEGGDGRAERRYVETAVELVDRLARLWRSAAGDRDWELAVAYNPYPDEALHAWYGWLDPDSPAYDPDVAGRLQPYMGQILSAVDIWLGGILDTLGEDGLLILSSDHGMTSADRVFHPNRLLRREGILAVDAAGRIDLSRTRAAYGGDFQIRVNHAGRLGGIVPPEEVPELVERLSGLLTELRDPESGSRVVSRIVGPDDPEARTWGVGPEYPRSGDLFLDLAPHTYESIDHGTGPILTDVPPMGVHGYHPDRPEMHALMVLRGPGVEHLRGTRQPVRHIDAAPTLAEWIGIEPPRNAAGSSLVRD